MADQVDQQSEDVIRPAATAETKGKSFAGSETPNGDFDKSSANELSSTSIDTTVPSSAAAGVASNAALTTNLSSTTSAAGRILQGKTIFVTGLAPRITKVHIEKLMSKFGTAVRIDFKDGTSYDGGGGSFSGSGYNRKGGGGGGGGKRYCFVEFSIREDAQRAMDSLNGKMLSGLKLVVQPAHERQTQSSSHGNQFNQDGTERGDSSSPGSGMSIYTEKKIVDRKIEELRRKILEKQQRQHHQQN
jgi:RNA recognition motif-containing protein